MLTSPNDWEIKKCLRLLLVLLLISLGLIGLSVLGFDALGLGQVVVFLFLTFAPGILILRILKIHNISVIESLAYSLGLSLASVMFIGALINFTLPYIGISSPISLMPVAVSLAVFTLILMGIAYVRDRDFAGSEPMAPRERLPLPSVLFLVLVLLLTVLGVTLIDSYQNNVLLIICIVIIASVVGLTAFGKSIQPNIYPLAVFAISLCLLYQTTLMSPYLVGTDIYVEYHFYQLAAINGFWDFSIPSTVNSCLSITMLAPIYSLLLNVSAVWVFKAIYPLLFALVPLILFCVFSRQMSQKKAFLAVFFFMSVPTFSLEMIALCRQQIAELFFALIVLLLVDRVISTGQKLALLVIFSMAIIVSHYSFGFIGFIYMGLFLPLIFILRSNILRKMWAWLTTKSGGLPTDLAASRAVPVKVLVAMVAVYFIAGFAWYGFVASGVNLSLLSRLWIAETGSITTELSKMAMQHPDFLDFSQRDALIQAAVGLDFSEASLQGKCFRVLQFITQIFLIIGCLRLLFRPKDLRFKIEYIALSVTSALLLLACVFVPGFAGLLNTTRMYHIALITLAPFCILGGEAIWLGMIALWHRLRHAVQKTRIEKLEDNLGYIKFVALAVLIPYFLFTSGFVYEVTRQDIADRVDTPYSIALSSYRLDIAGIFYWQDGAAARWLLQNASKEVKVYGDSYSGKLLTFYEFPGKLEVLPQYSDKLEHDSYIYFSAWNTAKNEITYTFSNKPGLRQAVSLDAIPGLITTIDSKNRIYVNGGAQILAPN